MGLVERLEKWAKELDGHLKHGHYSTQENAFIDRELLEQTAEYIRVLEAIDAPFVGEPSDFCGIHPAMLGVKNV